MSSVTEKQQGSDCKRWKVPALDEIAADSGARTHTQDDYGASGLLTIEQADSVQQKAYNEGFNRGHTEGRTSGEQILAAHIGRFQQLMDTLAHPFKDLDQEIEKRLVELAIAIARNVIRREIKTDPSQITVVVQEAVGVLQINSRTVQLRLHPEDAELIRTLISVPDTESPWQFTEDPSVTQGGCLVVTETSQVDATVETRLDNTVASLLRDEQ